MPLPAFGRAKRVTQPLGDKVRAQLIRGDDKHCASSGCTGSGSGSGSGSKHQDADLSGLSGCFFLFFSENEGTDEAPEECGDDLDDERLAGLSDGEGHESLYAVPAPGMIRDMVNPGIASPVEDRFSRCLEMDATAAAGRFAGLRPDPPAFRRAVMGSLREIRYNAGICTSKWKGSGGGLVAGSHEYIDVLTPPTASSPQRRYIVDVDFAGEFEIARPTAEYGRLVAELPRVFVGRPEGLRLLLRVLAEAARRSLRSRDMHVPPWRRSRYMQAKWLGPYRRTINPVPSPSSSATSPPSPAAASFGAGRGEATCQLVGFDAEASSAIIPVRTRCDAPMLWPTTTNH